MEKRQAIHERSGIVDGSPGIQQDTCGHACSRDGHVRSCERDMRDVTFCHGISGSLKLLGTTRHYRQGNLRAISGISSDLQLCVVYVPLYFKTLSISTLRAASIYAIYMLL
eukprot:780213-Amorphochlora_amoeboformis.AAC.1